MLGFYLSNNVNVFVLTQNMQEDRSKSCRKNTSIFHNIDLKSISWSQLTPWKESRPATAKTKTTRETPGFCNGSGSKRQPQRGESRFLGRFVPFAKRKIIIFFIFFPILLKPQPAMTLIFGPAKWAMKHCSLPKIAVTTDYEDPASLLGRSLLSPGWRHEAKVGWLFLQSFLWFFSGF